MLYFYHEIEDKTEELLTEMFDSVRICGYDYDAGRALKLIDRVAFDQEVQNYLENFEEVSTNDLTIGEKDEYMVYHSTYMYREV